MNGTRAEFLAEPSSIQESKSRIPSFDQSKEETSNTAGVKTLKMGIEIDDVKPQMNVDSQPPLRPVNQDTDDISIIDLISDSEEEDPMKDVDKYDAAMPQLWWASVAKKVDTASMQKIENGNKVVLLLHILTHASQLNEKVVLFSQCLKVWSIDSNNCS